MPHFIFYKPYGTLSQFINNGQVKRHHRLIGDWGEFPEGTMAVGRLDRDSEGLLLLTTDGHFSEAMRAKSVDKEYWVQVDGQPTDEALQRMRDGLELTHRGQKYQTRPCTVQRMSTPSLSERAKAIRDERHGPTSWLTITIQEGKFRQVRKMTAKIGHPTLRLFRQRVGQYTIDNLQPGEWRVIHSENNTPTKI